MKTVVESEDSKTMRYLAGLLNSRRLRDYPRLFLLTTALVLIGNVAFRSGWMGGLGQVIGSDFVTLYAAGISWRAGAASLYDFRTQEAIQQQLVAPSVLPGLNPYISPPYVAMGYSVLTHLPLVVAFVAWQILTVAAVIFAAAILSRRLLAPALRRRGMTNVQLVVITLSCFAFVEGFIVGQNHGVTLLLATLAVVYSLRGMGLSAGLCAGALIYKPQLAVGLLLVWLLWRRYRSLLGFAATAGIWVGTSLVLGGTEPFRTYVMLSDQLLRLPYTPGFPAYLMVTPYGFLATIFGDFWLNATQWFATVWAMVATIALAATAWRSRRIPAAQRGLVLAGALLYPLIVAPYTLLHDLILLVPVFVLLGANRGTERTLLYLAVFSYIGMLAFTFIGQAVGVAFVALIPILVAITQYRYIWNCSLSQEPWVSSSVGSRRAGRDTLE